MLSVRLGSRNLARHRWRTGLTLAGIGVSVALMVWTIAFMEGWMNQMVVAATAVDTGQLEVQTAGWADKPRPYESLAVNDSMLDVIRSVPGIAAVSPRVELYGLVGNERRSKVARILGVDPDLESNATPITKGIRRGRWLDEQPAPDGAREVVLGSLLAKQLDVGLGAELVVFAEAADGSLGNDLLQVVGVVETGNSAIDRGAVYMNIADARYLAALDGQANAILVRTVDPENAIAVSDALAARLGAVRDPDGAPEDAIVVRSWQELIPSLYQVIAMSRSSYWMMYALIYLVAAVGILNTQRMSALERRREFGVLIAIGMRPRRLFRTVLVESVVLGFAGSILGAILGGAVSWYHATAGLDLSLFTSKGTGFSYMGVAFTDRLYAALTVTSFVQPVVVMLLVAVLSGLWPAWTAARLQPAPTIAGRT